MAALMHSKKHAAAGGSPVFGKMTPIINGFGSGDSGTSFSRPGAVRHVTESETTATPVPAATAETRLNTPSCSPAMRSGDLTGGKQGGQQLVVIGIILAAIHYEWLARRVGERHGSAPGQRMRRGNRQTQRLAGQFGHAEARNMVFSRSALRVAWSRHEYDNSPSK